MWEWESKKIRKKFLSLSSLSFLLILPKQIKIFYENKVKNCLSWFILWSNQLVENWLIFFLILGHLHRIKPSGWYSSADRRNLVAIFAQCPTLHHVYTHYSVEKVRNAFNSADYYSKSDHWIINPDDEDKRIEHHGIKTWKIPSLWVSYYKSSHYISQS